jgi:4-amino-4-deoxy-L-arabinose transferase-like glycosyltransferase
VTRWVWAAAVAAAALQLLAAAIGPWGFATDELYYLDSLDRLDWGYVDHPPLSVAALWLVRAVLGTSLLAVRILPALCWGMAVLLAGGLARELSGGRGAQVLAALAVLVSPLMAGLTSFHSMNAIDVALWPAVAWLVARLGGGGRPWLWLAIGALLGLGLLNKFGIAALGAGVAIGVLLTPHRRWLATPWPWLGAAVSLAIVAPHVAWQVEHDWPFLEFQRNATEYKIVARTPLELVASQVLLGNPVAAPLWLGGLAWLLAVPGRTPHRWLGVAFATVWLLLLVPGSRTYYMAPALPIAFAGGAVGLEALARRFRAAWPVPAAIAALLISAPSTLLLSLPLLPAGPYLALQNALGIAIPSEDRGGSASLPIHLALRLHGPAVVDAVERALVTLSPEERPRAAVLASDFGSAAAVNWFGPARGLPRAISYHNSYWMWGPGDASGDPLVVLIDRRFAENLGKGFESWERVAEIDCPRCMPFLTNMSVYVCRRPRWPLAQMWPDMKMYL